MDVSTDRSTRTSVPRRQPAPAETLRLPRRRRPTGEAPPLPYHLQTSGVRWLIVGGVLMALTIAVFARGMRGLAVNVTVVDDAVVRWLTGLQAPGLVGAWRALAVISSWWVINGLLAGLLVALLVLRRFRHLIVVLVLAQLLTLVVQAWLPPIAQRPRPFGVVIGASWGGWGMPSLQVTLFAALLVGILYSMVPEGRWRNTGKWVAAGLVTLTALGRVALGADAPTDVLVAAAIGVTLPLVAFRLFAPNEVFPVAYRRGRAAHLDVGGPRGAAIRQGLEDQLGLIVTEVKPFGLAGSAGSTPLRITVKGDPPSYLFGKLYAKSHLRADRWYKLGRELLYGRLEDEKPFNAVRRLVQQEDYALHKLHLAGLPSPRPYGFVELTPDREYLLVTEFFDGAVELGEAEVDEGVIDDGLGIVRKLWDAVLAHRDVKPANLLVRDGKVLLIDVAFAEARPSPWRQAVDLANMMLCLALRSSPEQVYERAKLQFSVEEITEGFAASRGLTMPSQLRHLIRAQGRDLHGEFLELLPTRPRPVSIQRWSVRRVGLALLVLLGLMAVIPMVVSWSVQTDRIDNTSLYVSTVGCESREPLWLMAQAVPSASLVPCVPVLPVGWTLADIKVQDGRARFSFDTDRAGAAAVVVELTASCELAGAVELSSEQQTARRYLRVDRNAAEVAVTRAYTFPGGCVTQRLVAPAKSQDQLASEASFALGFTTRQELGQALSQRSSGRLTLDAAAR